MSDYPKSKNEWWEFVDTYWNQLESIVLRFYPNQEDFPKEGWPLPERNLREPQRACNVVVNKLRKEKPIWQDKGSFKEYINTLKKTRNVELNNIFQSSWFGMPESQSSRLIPGFYIFCDLCSEANILYED